MTEALPPDWPNRRFSRIRRGPVHEWHYQSMGKSGPGVLLLHGAGGSVHSYRDLLPILARETRVLAPDLPGHGFTRLGAQRRSDLTHMAQDLASLCGALDFRPRAIIGHSAGAAIALKMAMGLPEMKLICINPALQNFDGVAGVLFPAMARVLAAVPFTARLFSGASSSPDRVRRLIASTGSTLDDAGLELYRRLIAREEHVSGTLAMMAQWSLGGLLEQLPEIDADTLFIVGGGDRTVPPRVAEAAAERMPHARLHRMEGFGHLVHEEAPEEVAELCLAHLRA
jgi:magnesium chelatase accessory protein